MTTISFTSGATDIMCDFCQVELVEERSFSDAKDAIDSLGWKTSKDDNDEWVHKCKDCLVIDEEERAESIMERFDG